MPVTPTAWPLRKDATYPCMTAFTVLHEDKTVMYCRLTHLPRVTVHMGRPLSYNTVLPVLLSQVTAVMVAHVCQRHGVTACST